jgi:putative heme-binding domain-containing protein
MLGAWATCSPTVRGGILGLASERGVFVEVLLDLIESGRIPAGQINRAQQQGFLWNPDKAVQARAARLFSSANPDRRQVVKAYRQSVGTDGDPARGRGLFEQQCAVCHRFKDQGNAVGPDIAAFRDQPLEAWVLAILDPNAAVEAPFVGYTAAMKDGRELSGVIAAESASSVTLRTATGGEEVLLRNQIETFGSSGLSLMPEGFEGSLNAREMSDLIAFLRSRRD